MTTAHLFQLADSGFPVGGYAFSSGLEAAAQLPALRTPQGLADYIRLYIQQLVQGDWPFVRASWFANSATKGADIVQQYDAYCLGPATRHTSLMLGQNFMRLLQDLHKDILGSLYQQWREQKLAKHFAPLFGQTLRALGADERQVFDLMTFCAIRDQFSAAIRLGLIGPLAASQRQLAMIAEIDAIYQSATTEIAMATRPVPFIEMMQLCQPHLYSRLFQS